MHSLESYHIRIQNNENKKCLGNFIQLMALDEWKKVKVILEI